MSKTRCIHCMELLDKYPCPHCGYSPSAENQVRYALTGHILAGRYLVGRILGQGGFGITYLGWDLKLEDKVAIKEFYPSGHVSRYTTNGVRLEWNSTPTALAMRKTGLEAFLKEARKMSKISHVRNAVTVLDVLTENDTAYIIMDYVAGKTLKATLAENGPMEWAQAKEIFLPVIRTMSEIHQAGIIHRDISPDNLMLKPSGDAILLDLGAAKDISVDGGMTTSFVAKAGFSPLEQYGQKGHSGPWTDVYAMAATIYYTLTGTLPTSSTDRLEKDDLRWDLPALTALPKHVLSALNNAMKIRVADRTQTMDDFLQELEAAPEVLVKKNNRGLFLGIASSAACFLLGILIGFWVGGSAAKPEPLISQPETTIPQITEKEIRHTYTIHQEDVTWKEAFDRAKELGGYLAHIDSMEEMDYLVSILEKMDYSDQYVMIGGARDLESREYYWLNADNSVTGDVLNSPNYWAEDLWLTGEPSFEYNGEQEHVLEMHYSPEESRWGWNDISVEDLIGKAVYKKGHISYIVEYESEIG